MCGHNMGHDGLWSKDQASWVIVDIIKIAKYLTEHLALLQGEGLVPAELHLEFLTKVILVP